MSFLKKISLGLLSKPDNGHPPQQVKTRSVPYSELLRKPSRCLTKHSEYDPNTIPGTRESMSASDWPPYEVYPYTIQTLESLLADKASADPSIVASKIHRTYFEEYFSFIGARTILAENYYIDHDYLDDYSEYYVRCFAPYRRTCVRLHFFDVPFTSVDFANLLTGEESALAHDILRESYLGFVVVKPLPASFVGRTCLRTYPTENTGRSFPIPREYEANLFGFKLAVTTLAFQEQDSVAAACATSALWAAFQGTGKLFQHTIPSPIQITKAATTLNSTNTRTLPNQGLTIEQMATAIRSLSLEPFGYQCTQRGISSQDFLLRIPSCQNPCDNALCFGRCFHEPSERCWSTCGNDHGLSFGIKLPAII